MSPNCRTQNVQVIQKTHAGHAERTKESENSEQNAGYPAKDAHSNHRTPNGMKCVTRKRFYCLEAMSKTS